MCSRICYHRVQPIDSVSRSHWHTLNLWDSGVLIVQYHCLCIPINAEALLQENSHREQSPCDLWYVEHRVQARSALPSVPAVQYIVCDENSTLPPNVDGL